MKELNQFVSFSFGQLQFKISNCTLKLLIIFLGIFIIDFQQAVLYSINIATLKLTTYDNTFRSC